MPKHIDKILYIHYLVSARDGSHTHTSSFAQFFGEICRERGIDFEMVCPEVIDEHDEVDYSSSISRIRSFIGRFYLRDIKHLLVQLRRRRRELALLRKLQPDVVISRHEDNPSILWACSRLNIPVIVEINSPEVEEINAHYRHIPGLANLFTNKYAMNHADGAYSVSTVLAEQLKGMLKHPIPVAAIPNGADPSLFDRAISGQPIREKYGIPAGDIVIGFTGTFLPWHGIEQLFDIFPRLLREHPNLSLLLVGQENDLVRKLTQQAKEQGFSEKVVFTGFVPRLDIPPYVAAFDIAIMPNSNSYGSPLKLFEYMAMGKAIAMVNTKPIAEVFEHEVDGLLFTQGSLDDMERTLRRLIESDALRQQYADSAYRHLCERYTWRHNARRVFDLAEEVHRDFHNQAG